MVIFLKHRRCAFGFRFVLACFFKTNTETNPETNTENKTETNTQIETKFIWFWYMYSYELRPEATELSIGLRKVFSLGRTKVRK